MALALVIAVDLRGFVGMGAQRWIDLGVIQLQPSELMNVALVLALARYFHSLSDEDVGRIRFLILPALMICVPAALVLKQPDLGTAIMLLIGGAVLFFIAGVRLRFFVLIGGGRRCGATRRSGIFCAITRRPGSIPFSIRRATRSAPAITSCNRRSRSAPAACSAKAFCKAARAI